MNALPDVDVAIVGGGVSGIYAGWRLVNSPLGTGPAANWGNQRGKLKVAVYEGSPRIGGRMLSAQSPLFGDAIGELGGMRYVVPSQTRVSGLVEKVLGLPFHEQTVTVPGNIAYLRGRLLRLAQLGDPLSLPYFFDPAECTWLAARAGTGQSPASLIDRTLIKLMPEILKHVGTPTLRSYLRTVTLDSGEGGTHGRNQHLWEFGMWNLLARGMSADAYAAARATVGYDSLGGNYNALDIIAEYFNFTPDVKYRMVDGGYERVPWELSRRFRQQGGTIHHGSWLDGFAGTPLPDGSRGVRLRFGDGNTVTARAIVLAMPRRAIELLHPDGEVLDPKHTQVRKGLSSVSGFPLFKMFLLYPECWWQDAGVTKGRSVTDLPVRQCYYWPSGLKGDVVPPRTGPGLIMAYDDMANETYWSGLDVRSEAQKAIWKHDLEIADVVPRHHLFSPAHGKHPPKPPKDPWIEHLQQNWTRHSATEPMVMEMHRELMMMHGVDQAPAPIDAAYVDWSRDPYGGGSHFWNVAFDSEHYLSMMTQPVADFPCFICGEAYSTAQTWVEGALQTAELVLQKKLGIPYPDWESGPEASHG
jgi:monoamine oxidase